MLDRHGAGIARLVERGEADEVAVVAPLPFHVLAVAVLQAHDLRGAGLARHLDVGDGHARACPPCRAR
jgi:hypothetical protein